VFYSRDRRVFELRSEATRRLARQMKAAVRLGKKRNGELYRAVLCNSFNRPPLVPAIEQSTQHKRLAATYTVQVSCLK